MMTRFWVLLLAVLLGIASCVAWMTRTSANRQLSETTADLLRRDRMEIELWLKLDSRMRLDTIAPIAAQPQIVSALRSASSNRRTLDRATKTKLVTSLKQLNKQLQELRADVLFLVDSNGKEVARVDGKTPANAPGYARVPLVADAIVGYERDGVWSIDGVPHRMAARPVIDSGRYVGALVHGVRFDERLTRRLADRLGGATVSFFTGNTSTIASANSDKKTGLSPDALASGLNEALKSESLLAGRASAAITVPGGKALYSLLADTSANEKTGYAIGRPSPPHHTGLFGNPTQQDVASINWLPIVGLPLLLGLLGLALMYFERDKPIAQLLAATEAARLGQNKRLSVEGLRGTYKRLANGLDALIAQKENGDDDSASAAELNKILRATRETTGDVQPYVGFVEQSVRPDSRRTPMRPDAMPTPIPAEPPPPPSPAVPKAAASNHASFGQEDDDDEDEATMVAEVPQELIDAAAARLNARAKDKAQGDGEEEQHLREVFEQFAATQKECGEGQDTIAYDRFASKLRATRDQILKSHDATGVRFTVYIKDGKAALKANPVRG